MLLMFTMETVKCGMIPPAPIYVPIQAPMVAPIFTPTVPSLNTDIITTIAGTGVSSYSGDNGQAISAGIYNPYGVALDASGRLRHSIY